jgi:hypothetical protein
MKEFSLNQDGTKKAPLRAEIRLVNQASETSNFEFTVTRS